MRHFFEDEEKETIEPETVQEEPVEEEPKPKKSDGYVMRLPESEKTEEEVVKNSKPFWTMRVAGGLIDVFLIFLLTLGLYQLFVRTPMNSGLQKYGNGMVEIQDTYKLKPLIDGSDQTVGHKLYENEEGYANYSKYLSYLDEETNLRYVVVDNEDISDELIKKYVAVVTADETYKAYQFNYR